MRVVRLPSVHKYLPAPVLEEWDRLPVANVQRLIHSMRRRRDACIAVAGGSYTLLNCISAE